jgi:2-keto-4-pentenoate hydratase/2-oxohepta-3-ene-1,7-dioic acid hydratase in catechol pathway
MTLWVRYLAGEKIGFGSLTDGMIKRYRGDMFGEHSPEGSECALSSVRLLAPCTPSKMLALWNNFHERAKVEHLQPPEHPLYFVKTPNSFAGEGDRIPRPAGYSGAVAFEGELGVVIGKRCRSVTPEQAPDYIFGYTCVNDVTAGHLLKLDPVFVHWTRAKSFDGFSPFGPGIATGLDPAVMRVRVTLAGEEKQNYPVADMIFSPSEIVSRISDDMTLEPGDIVSCGTSIGACPMRDGDTVEVSIPGIGVLTNRFG